MLVNDKDRGGGANLIAYGEIAGLELEFLKQFCLDGGVVFDCGANIGNHTMAFSRFVGPVGAVFAFEPQEHCCQLLSANVALNNMHNVQIFKYALGNSNEPLLIPWIHPEQEFNFGGVSLKELGFYNAFSRVDQKTLNEFIYLPGCNLLKIDVEGYEETILSGGSEFVKKNRPVIYCENNRPEQFDGLMSFFKSNNYIVKKHLPPSFNKNNFNKNGSNHLHGDFREPNLVALPVEKQHLMVNTDYVENL